MTSSAKVAAEESRVIDRDGGSVSGEAYRDRSGVPLVEGGSYLRAKSRKFKLILRSFVRSRKALTLRYREVESVYQ